MKPLIYLSGVVLPQILTEPRRDLGVLLTPAMGNAPDLSRTPWAADNGCFANPYFFDEDAYLEWLAKRSRYAATCLWATIPDVPCDWESTTANFSLAREIAELGYVPAIVGQDGMTAEDVPWEVVGGLFLGGSDAWKLGDDARAMTAEAKARGCWVHMGRVNSLKRMQLAQSFGCDSVDGTYLNFGRRVDGVPENLPRLRRFLDTVNYGGRIVAPPNGSLAALVAGLRIA